MPIAPYASRLILLTSLAAFGASGCGEQAALLDVNPASHAQSAPAEAPAQVDEAKPDALEEEPPATDVVSLDAATAAALIETASELANCVAAEEDNFESDPSGVRIAAVEYVDGWAASSLEGPHVVVTLVNVSPHGVWTYPGARFTTAAPVLADVHGGDVTASQDWQLYGLGGCDSLEIAVGIDALESGSTAALAVSATNELGASTLDKVAVEVTRP